MASMTVLSTVLSVELCASMNKLKLYKTTLTCEFLSDRMPYLIDINLPTSKVSCKVGQSNIFLCIDDIHDIL